MPQPVAPSPNKRADMNVVPLHNRYVEATNDMPFETSNTPLRILFLLKDIQAFLNSKAAKIVAPPYKPKRAKFLTLSNLDSPIPNNLLFMLGIVEHVWSCF